MQTPEFPKYTSLGCYPIVYLVDAHKVLCPACATEHYEDTGEIAEGHIHWEGPPIECETCNEEIESAYGDPWAEETEETEGAKND